MLNYIDPLNVLFLDVETVPQEPNFDVLNDEMKALWKRKARRIGKEGESADDVYGRAGIYAEFGKIVCISAGIIFERDNERWFRLKSFYGDDEKELLLGFANLLHKYADNKDHYLCAHNGKEFDYPYIARRMLLNGIKLPPQLDIAGLKPWEVKHLDTMQLWAFGDHKHFTSLKLLTTIFSIPSPKDDIDGSQVASVYWQDRNVERIATYCQKDVLAVAQLLLRFKGEPLIKPNNVEIRQN